MCYTYWDWSLGKLSTFWSSKLRQLESGRNRFEPRAFLLQSHTLHKAGEFSVPSSLTLIDAENWASINTWGQTKTCDVATNTTHQPVWTYHPGVSVYPTFVFLETGYTLLLLPTCTLHVPCLFQAKGYPPAWFPSQLWGAGVESLGLRRTWPGPVSGAVNIHLPHGLSTWVVSRFGGQCHFAPSDCAPHRFAVSEGALRERLSDVQSRDAGLPITQSPYERPGSSHAEAHVYHQDWGWSLQTSFTLYLAEQDKIWEMMHLYLHGGLKSAGCHICLFMNEYINEQMTSITS